MVYQLNYIENYDGFMSSPIPLGGVRDSLIKTGKKGLHLLGVGGGWRNRNFTNVSDCGESLSKSTSEAGARQEINARG